MSNADYKPESAFVTVWSLHYFTNTVAVPPPKKREKHLAPRPSGECLIVSLGLVSECHAAGGQGGFCFCFCFSFHYSPPQWKFPVTTPFPFLSPCCLLLLGFRFIVSSWQGILEFISGPLTLPSSNFSQNDSHCLILNHPRQVCFEYLFLD